MGDDAARADHAAVPDRHTRQNDRPAANPYGLTNADRPRRFQPGQPRVPVQRMKRGYNWTAGPICRSSPISIGAQSRNTQL